MLRPAQSKKEGITPIMEEDSGDDESSSSEKGTDPIPEASRESESIGKS